MVKTMWRNFLDGTLLLKSAGTWDEAVHPRHPAGSDKGGEFAPKSGDALRRFHYSKTDFNKTYARLLPDGFEELITVNGPKDGGKGKYSVVTNAYGFGVHPFAPDPRSSERDEIYAESADEAARQAVLAIQERQELFDEILEEKLAERDSWDTDPLTDNIHDYVYDPSREHLDDLVSNIRRDRISFRQAQRTLDQIPFDENGEVTLFRGGSPNGLSWSLSRDTAEDFARYGYGGVPIHLSGLVGIEAIRSGANIKPATVYDKKFKRNQLLLYIGRSEKEVIVNPDVFKTSVGK